MKTYSPLLAALALFLALTACTEPIFVGSDLLEGDRAALGETADVPFQTFTVRDDSLLTYEQDLENVISGYSVGQITDPVFGTTTQGAYIIPRVPRRTGSGLPDPPPFSFELNRGADSIVLILPIDTNYFAYGPGQDLDLELGLIAQRVDLSMSDYTTAVEVPTTGQTVNAVGRLRPSFNVSQLYDTVYSNGDTISRRHLRVRMTDDYLADFNRRVSRDFDSDSAFNNIVLPGVFLRPTANSNALFGLVAERSTPAAGQAPPFAGFYAFYRDTSAAATPSIYRMPVDAVLPAYRKDYAGTIVDQLLTDTNTDDLTAVQGQAGVMTAVSFSNLDSLRGKAINKAELTVYRVTPDDYDYADYPAPERLSAWYFNQNDQLVPILDRAPGVLRGQITTEVFNTLLGGQEQTDENGNIFYRPRFSVHLQEMIEGTVPRTIYLRTDPVARTGARALLTGPQSPLLPATVRVTFTEVN